MRSSKNISEDMERNASALKNLANVSYGEWFRELGDWDWFVTRTLAPGYVTDGFTKPGVGTARKCLLDLLRVSDADKVLCVMEWQSERDVPHLHALVETGASIDNRYMNERDWIGWGMARWLKYDPGRGAGFYLAKYLTKALEHDKVELYFLRRGAKRALEGRV